MATSKTSLPIWKSHGVSSALTAMIQPTRWLPEARYATKPSTIAAAKPASALRRRAARTLGPNTLNTAASAYTYTGLTATPGSQVWKKTGQATPCSSCPSSEIV